MRFGLFVPQGWRLDLVGIAPDRQWETMLGVARLAEAGPFESIWVYDHFHTVPVPTEEATHEAWTLMSALAVEHVERVRLGQMCTCTGYRQPDVPGQGGRHRSTSSPAVGSRWASAPAGTSTSGRAYGYGFPSRRGPDRDARRGGRDHEVGPGRTARPPSPASTTRWRGRSAARTPLQRRRDPAVDRRRRREARRCGSPRSTPHYTNFDGTLDGFRAQVDRCSPGTAS